jgi:hypothetical protein
VSFPWYVITGEINVDNFTKLQTLERGFVWRGFTLDCEMKPSAANYDRYGKLFTCDRKGVCEPLAEIKRVAEKIYEMNKLQKFPFEIPLFVRKLLFSRFYQPEEKLFKEMQITEFPSSLAQAMSLVQHEFGGTSLLDFSINKYKALYFAIGKGNNFSQNSRIFGMGVSYFETHKNNFPKEIFDIYGKKFDLLYPSYFMNEKIAHQEGVFVYQKFDIDITKGEIKGDKRYENIIEFFEARYEEGKKNNGGLFKRISIDDFLKITEKGSDKPIFYVLLDVPAKEKPVLKEYLNSIGITDDFMMAQVVSAACKSSHAGSEKLPGIKLGGGTSHDKPACNKNKAKMLCRENKFNLNGEVTFASKNKTSAIYWANPNIKFITTDWWLLLNDYTHRNLHIFYIPANSIKNDQIKTRADNSDKIDLQIKYENDLFEDSRSGIQFVKWFRETISY